LGDNGFTIESLANGDALVSVRHDGRRNIVIVGPDPQKQADAANLRYDGDWKAESGYRSSSSAGASASYRFTGNQVRVLGTVGPDGGWADAYIDGEKQLTVVECWNPAVRASQPIFIKKGLGQGDHEVKIVVQGGKNTISKGTEIRLDGVQTSDAQGVAGEGEGGGPTGPQRMIFGYLDREDYIDSHGNAWRPATEWVVRSGFSNDTVDKAMWTKRRSMYIGNTDDEELYRYGAHGKEFWANLTVGPGKYDLRLKFADTPLTAWMEREGQWERVLHDVQVLVNGRQVVAPMSISKEAGGIFRAVDKVVSGITPDHGMIRIDFVGANGHEACVQALELTPAH
jgi:hypothetical protein